MSGSRGRGAGRRVAWCRCRGASGEDNKGCDKEYKNSFGTAHFASPIKSGSYLMRDNFYDTHNSSFSNKHMADGDIQFYFTRSNAAAMSSAIILLLLFSIPKLGPACKYDGNARASRKKNS